MAADHLPSVARAAGYIVSQLDDRGLAFCTARDERGNVWAIAGWRNVIPGYTLNGAVTEINAECAAALRAAGHLTRNIDGDAAEADIFSNASRRIISAMDEHLINPDNGLYYLNIDVDGVIHTDVTGDEIFPVMFRTCDEETGYRIIRRLNTPDFWTSAGLRTVSKHDPQYDPSGNVGLLGGVWPGLTWWYAFAAARYHPEFMVEALTASFEHYAANPRKNNTVPGQFSEYFDGESLINRGMRLSPWEPPRFLWAAIEGVCGVMLTTGLPRVAPIVPSNWKWVALKRLPYHGAEFSYFATRRNGTFHISATSGVDCEFETELYDENVSASVEIVPGDASVVALRRADEIALFVGSSASVTTTFDVRFDALLDGNAAYRMRIYDSERDAWLAGGPEIARASHLALLIERGGYRLIVLSGNNSATVCSSKDSEP